MNEDSRRVYIGLGRAFVAVGGIVAVGSVMDRVFGWGFFRGSPVGTALFLVAIGALLLWTVRQADSRPTSEPGTTAEAGTVEAPDLQSDAGTVPGPEDAGRGRP